jgi:regulator of protease activity HflC (stomatin/prohibitin superfamily)
VPQDFKETTAQFTSPEITLNRPALRKITVGRLREELGRYDVRVVDVFVNNVAYSRAYTDAIESKQVQVQQALEAQAKVAQSKAEAEQAIAKARGDAESIALKGRALRNNPQVLQLESIDKLNPNAQLVICTGNTCPSILPGNLTPATK